MSSFPFCYYFNSLIFFVCSYEHISLSLLGRVLNIETQDMKFRTWGNEVDPDKSYWYEGGKETVFYLNVIRVFYESGHPAYEEIGNRLKFLPVYQ